MIIFNLSRDLQNSPDKIQKMHKFSYSSIFPVILLALFGTFGGGLIAGKIADDHARDVIWLIGILYIAFCTFLLLKLVFFKQKSFRNELIAKSIVINLGFTWFLANLVFPLFFLVGFFSVQATIFFVLFILMTLWFLKCAKHQFNCRWDEKVDLSKKKNFPKNSVLLSLDSVNKNLDLEMIVFMPVFLEKFRPLIYILLIGSMVAGLNFRNTFPMFSVYAWGVPSIIFCSLCIQLSAYPIFMMNAIIKYYAREKIN